jgi:hypothetical protein
MARGWESKSIESQQEEAARSRAGGGRTPSAEERQAATARETLELVRAKCEGDLRRARSDAHREMLRRALEDLDRQLKNPGSG